MSYESEKQLYMDCMRSSVMHKQAELTRLQSINDKKENTTDIDQTAQRLRDEIRTIRQFYQFKYNENMAVELMPIESPNYQKAG